ncbi:MAG: xylulokinase [Chloroflexota bacterium]|nr:xylulokinase [Chloroflexota bacterium]
MSASLLIGIDLGTSSLKTVVIDSDGRLLARAAHEYPIDSTRPGWAEQDPESWLAATVATIRQALDLSGIPAAHIAGIGLSGQMHGTVCLDESGQVLRPAIIWADQRSASQVQQVYDLLGSRRLGELTANPLDTGFMLASWLWLRENEPPVARATSHLLLPKDWLRFRLTGNLGTEPSDASSTLLFDTAARSWSSGLLEPLGIDGDILPPIHQSAQVAGGLTAELAMATGLRQGTPVVFGGSDQSCQALGNGVIEPGVISCTIGTGGQLFAPTRQPAYDSELRLHLFCHVLPEQWHQMAAILSAGLSLRWLRDNVLTEMSYTQMADQAATVPAGAQGLFFLPHLAGERTPYMDPSARASFIGLTLSHDRSHMTRAVMEGVVFALKQGLELMAELGVPVRQIVASGGAVRHPLWLQLQADIFDRPITQTKTIEAAAVGAALLAGIGTGVYADAHSAVEHTVRGGQQPVLPNPQRAARYAESYETYVRLFPALQETDVFG